MIKREHSVQNHMKVFETVQKRKRLLKTKHSRNTHSEVKKMVKKGHSVQDHMRVFETV